MRKPISRIREFLQAESASGIVLVLAAAVSMVWANSSLGHVYEELLHVPVVVRIGDFGLDKSLLHWINDGLMTVFFLLVGLEIKREFLEGELSSPAKAALPAIAALGGMVVPAAVYLALNAGDPVAVRGWAIPAATDIAFAVGVLALLGPRAPLALKVFLLALAILDDLGAIIIIAAFYTADLSPMAIGLAAMATLVLALFNVTGITRLAPYILTGIVLWVLVLKSGVHATLAGVVLAFVIPLRVSEENGEAPALILEHALLPWVAFGIMPIFAFANAGVSLAGMSPSILLEPIPLGIALGLFLGKQVGVMGATWLAVRTGAGALPAGVSWLQMYGTAALTGIGFTMSLFIGGLAFSDPQHGAEIRIGVLTGSLVSAFVGYSILYFAAIRRFRTARRSA